jgi:phosphate transport system substrate-binding protein
VEIALLQNKYGNYVYAGGEGGTLALAGADFPPDLIAWVEDPVDLKAYPIATFTWMLFYKKQDHQKAEYLRKIVKYG